MQTLGIIFFIFKKNKKAYKEISAHLMELSKGLNFIESRDKRLEKNEIQLELNLDCLKVIEKYLRVKF